MLKRDQIFTLARTFHGREITIFVLSPFAIMYLDYITCIKFIYNYLTNVLGLSKIKVLIHTVHIPFCTAHSSYFPKLFFLLLFT